MSAGRRAARLAYRSAKGARAAWLAARPRQGRAQEWDKITEVGIPDSLRTGSRASLPENRSRNLGLCDKPSLQACGSRFRCSDFGDFVPFEPFSAAEPKSTCRNTTSDSVRAPCGVERARADGDPAAESAPTSRPGCSASNGKPERMFHVNHSFSINHRLVGVAHDQNFQHAGHMGEVRHLRTGNALEPDARCVGSTLERRWIRARKRQLSMVLHAIKTLDELVILRDTDRQAAWCLSLSVF